ARRTPSAPARSPAPPAHSPDGPPHGSCSGSLHERSTRLRLHHVRNDSLGTAGAFRESVHFAPGPGILLIHPSRARNRDSDPAFCVASYRFGSANTHAAAAIASASGVRLPFASTASARRCVSTSGMLIRTGHTSKHAPHSDDAYGSEAACLSCMSPTSCGARIAPIGPG